MCYGIIWDCSWDCDIAKVYVFQWEVLEAAWNLLAFALRGFVPSVNGASMRVSWGLSLLSG